MYTELFSEAHAVLAHQYVAGATTEQNTPWINMAHYHRLAICVHVQVVGVTVDMDVEISTSGDGAGENVFTLDSATQLVAADDNTFVIFEIPSEKLGKPTGAPAENYDWVRLEFTPSGAATASIVVYGIEPRFSPVPLTLVDEVVRVGA